MTNLQDDPPETARTPARQWPRPGQQPPADEPTVADPESETAASVVEGKRPSPPFQGFGKLWRKTYRVRLTGTDAEPPVVIATWKEHFDRFWPEGNTFYAPLTGVEPGELALLDLEVAAGVKLSTGVMVANADATSFTLVTTEGHFFAGWISFSATEDEGVTVAQVEVLARASDPLFEIGLMLGGLKREDQFWRQTLRNLAAFFSTPGARIETAAVVADPRRHWSRAGNVRHNTALRSLGHRASTRLAAAGRSLRRLAGRVGR